MIETKCFEELNIFNGTNPTPDLRLDMPPPEETTGCFPFRRKVSTIWKKRLSFSTTYENSNYYKNLVIVLKTIKTGLFPFY